MTIRRVTSPHVPEPPPERWSNCLVSDGIAYVSGMTARGTDPARARQDGRVRAGQADLRQDQGHGRGGRRRHGRRGQGHDLRHQHQEQHQGVGGAPRVLHRRLPGLDPGRGERARRTRDPGRDRGDRPHRQGQALGARASGRSWSSSSGPRALAPHDHAAGRQARGPEDDDGRRPRSLTPPSLPFGLQRAHGLAQARAPSSRSRRRRASPRRSRRARP